MTARDWLAKRAELEEAATPAPWHWHGYGKSGQTLAMPNPGFHELNILKTTDDWPPCSPDAAFITDARTSAPAMRKALEAVLAIHERLETSCARCAGGDREGSHPETCGPVCAAECDPWPCPTVATITAALESTP